MKQYVLGACLTLLALFAAYESLEAYRWKKIADKRGFYAEAAGAFLFAPSGVLVDKTGDELTRQQLLDALLHTTVEHTPGLHFKR
jgi:hypothetical protein